MTSRSLYRLLPAAFSVQAGFHGFTGALPVALAAAAYGDVSIGLIVGSASVAQIAAAPLAGALIDRVGPQRMMLVGAVAYLTAAVLIGMAPLDPSQPPLILIAARVLQGLAFAIVLPAVLTLVPLLAPRRRRGLWLAIALLSQNMTLAVMPAIGLWLLATASLTAVAAFVGALIAFGFLMTLRPARQITEDGSWAELPTSARRRYGLAFRRAWLGPLAITLLSVAYWGIVIAYLPPRAELAGTTSAYFFVGYGLSVIVSRLPAGWLADRQNARPLVSLGLIVSAGSIMALMLPPTAATMVVGGALSGLAAGLVLTPMLLALTHRSGEADRGSAFALFSVVSGAAYAIGSIGSAPIVAAFGFEAALMLGLGTTALAGLVLFVDRSFSGPANAADHAEGLTGSADGAGSRAINP